MIKVPTVAEPSHAWPIMRTESVLAPLLPITVMPYKVCV